ncbi:putative copper chaperone CsoZ [Staphylococcus auricularis]|uniref:putative copper chaperone CsoZ n=1 Tax=Staphylococcus auricularis TaxID=29379 RepID=UPI003EB8CF99
MKQTKTIYLEPVKDQTEAEHIVAKLTQLIGVDSATFNHNLDEIEIEFDTPMNLNTLEKAVYDLGCTVLY